MPVPQWNADIITPDNEASAEIISGGGLVKDETGAVGVSVDGETIVINNDGELQAVGGGIPYNVFKCRYAAGTASSVTSAIAKWKDTESSDNIWYVALYDKAEYLFSNDTGLVEVMDATIQLPILDTTGMFQGCTALTSVPLFDLSSVTNTSFMFSGCASLTSVPLFDLSSVTNTSFMFYGCTSLTSVPLFDLSSATNTSSMFSSCNFLTSVPLFDLASSMDTSGMFYDCTSLTSVPLFDLSSATNTSSMFNICTSLTIVPLFDLTSVTNTSSMFYGCTSLTSVPLFDLTSATNTKEMFSGCTSLTSVPLFDLSSATNTSSMFKYCTSVETGALSLYQQVSSQANPPATHLNMFKNCGSQTVSGAQELAQIPSSWGGTGA